MDLSEIKGEGIVLDIDETLSDTIGYLVLGLQNNFGNPENLSVREVVDKYRYTWNVPYWQSDEALAWVKENCRSNDVISDLPVIDGAKKFVDKIHKIVPVVGYVTARPDRILDGTKKWLAKHGFPEAPVVCRPLEVPLSELNKWKADVLKELHPKVRGIVDDNPELATFLDDYGGDVFLYNKDSVEDGANCVPCVDWETVYEEVKNRFG